MNRMGAALINVRHPELFRCLGACGNNWYDLAAIVLKPSAAVQQRVNCLGWRDMGSLFFNCGWDSGDDCRNGCPPRHEWCDRRGASHGGGIESQQNCHVGGFLHEMPGCCIAFPPDDWTGVLAFQDAFAPHGPCDRETKNCDRSDQEEGWLFDEIILDRERYPWDPDLGDMIEAVIIAPWASAEAKDFARAVHTAILAEISGKTGNVTESSLPLLFYDVEEREAPFSLELPARFQPPCTSPDDSKCQDDGNDCCAPAGIGEVAACADGFVPVRFHSPCDRWVRCGRSKCARTPCALPPFLTPRLRSWIFGSRAGQMANSGAARPLEVTVLLLACSRLHPDTIVQSTGTVSSS
jgi:hypothetical protein